MLTERICRQCGKKIPDNCFCCPCIDNEAANQPIAGTNMERGKALGGTCGKCGIPYSSHGTGCSGQLPIGNFINYGWICPVCRRGNSPFTSSCPCEKTPVKSITNYSFRARMSHTVDGYGIVLRTIDAYPDFSTENIEVKVIIKW